MIRSFRPYQVRFISKLFRNMLGHSFLIIFLALSMGEHMVSAAIFPRNEVVGSSGIEPGLKRYASEELWFGTLAIGGLEVFKLRGINVRTAPEWRVGQRLETV